MSKTFAILGSGMQGTAAAFDLAKFASPDKIVMGDVSLAQAQHAAHRVNALVGEAFCEPRQVDALDSTALHGFLKDVDVLLSCVPYWMHPKIAAVAVQTGTHMLDLGGNTEVTLETLALDAKAKEAGVSLVPDTGLAPGLVNSIGLYLLEHLDKAETIKLYCGVLPQNPQPPFNYKLTFNVEGLVTEYDFEAVALRNGEIAMIETLTELEELHIEELGKMEAFVTSGGTSTAPYSLQGKVDNYEYKTIRYPGHCELVKVFKDFGFWSPAPIEIGGSQVVPRQLFYKVFGDALSRFEDQDLCVVRGVGLGTKGEERVQLQVDIFDKQCDKTGFTSMERLTGFSMAIHAIEVAEGRVAAGGVRYEDSMTGTRFLEELRRRGIHVKFSEEPLDSPVRA
ncbi:MAG: saccharopine dehydrogenase NADP-binding domain-containing protein [Fimbriimonas ginsengisoli]|uniref:Saccharopine dehydrogenase NADP-binding domain-containing protein n=1 Tax=Fimbriimonas ginsengisoli TaxID=1005039 RepID=A0A931PSL9_FIMGI|nr:saccharopine dehydrogenase NADP-binding domain-containing protein [Fimbriimonas ginsengisoli]MBI3721582.1 saccharopine dehydrogenase NADP-binding domain-containing protein [Fimbriimonas ginsengisoli]